MQVVVVFHNKHYYYIPISNETEWVDIFEYVSDNILHDPNKSEFTNFSNHDMFSLYFYHIIRKMKIAVSCDETSKPFNVVDCGHDMEIRMRLKPTHCCKHFIVPNNVCVKCGKECPQSTLVMNERCGHELLLYQERNLFDLLRFLKYLVDVMTANNVIWGVGRGSSVASYVLYKLGVHKIDSMFYELDVEEFLR